MGDIEYSLRNNPGDWQRVTYYDIDVYEVNNFGKSSEKALVKVFHRDYSLVQRAEVQQFAKLGVLLGQAWNPHTFTYYIAIKKVGRFASEFKEEEKLDTKSLLSEAEKWYKDNYGMDLKTK